MANEMRKTTGFGSISTIFRLTKMLGFRQIRMRTLPLLNKSARDKRLDWASKLLSKKNGPFGKETTVTVHCDEKWFFSLQPQKRYWIGPGEQPLICHINSKSHLKKVMFLGVVGQPVPSKDFDGKIGLYPVVRQYVQKRTSKKHDIGEKYEKSATTDTHFWHKMMKDKVIPDILRLTSHWAKKIVIQMDNAPGHGGGRADIRCKTIDVLDSWVTKHKKGLLAFCGRKRRLPEIQFVSQPSRSPDLNVLDLGAWNSIQQAVEQLKKGVSKREIEPEEIRQACQNAWSLWDGQSKLEKLFNTLHRILVAVRDCHGGNQYDIPRS